MAVMMAEMMTEMRRGGAACLIPSELTSDKYISGQSVSRTDISHTSCELASGVGFGIGSCVDKAV